MAGCLTGVALNATGIFSPQGVTHAEVKHLAASLLNGMAKKHLFLEERPKNECYRPCVRLCTCLRVCPELAPVSTPTAFEE